MKVKDGVDLDELRDEMRAACPIIDEVHQELAQREAIATSTKDGKHSVKRSAHYRGDAVDLRTWYADGDEFAIQLRLALGENFVVLHESDHVHVHWSPVYVGDTSPTT